MRNARQTGDALHVVRQDAAAAANAEDAAIWRWFSVMFEERRIRWRDSHSGWLVTIDHRQVAGEATFDQAIRAAKVNLESRCVTTRTATATGARANSGVSVGGSRVDEC